MIPPSRDGKAPTNRRTAMVPDSDPTTDPVEHDPKPDPTADPKPDLGDAGKKALDAERKARREAERASADLAARLKEIEDKDKSDTDKLREQVETLTKQATESATKAMRLEVASAKGLTPAQAKRLVGSTQEELEADADEILEAFPAASGGATPPPTRKPSPDLKGGGDPSADEPVDGEALAKKILERRSF